jgi:hypothetical protein
MARTQALSITTDGSTKDQLAEIYGQVIDSVQKLAVSMRIKNPNYSGDPTAGSVEIDRFANATSNPYGTARTNGKGDQLKNSGKVTININQDKEIVEEVARKDVKLFGVGAILAKRAANHDLRMVAELDRAYFSELETAGTVVSGLLAADPIEDSVETLIQSVETTVNDWVDGVDRTMIVLSVKPAIFGKLRNYLDTVNDGKSGEETLSYFHGVEVISNIRQTKDIIATVYGSAAQPVTVDEYQDEKINLANDHAVELFYSYGTKAVTPDLVKYATLG